MSDRVKIRRTGLLPESAILPGEVLKCPQCGGTSLDVYGYWRRNFMRVFVEGKEESLKMDDAYSEGVASIVCHACGQQCNIESDVLIEMAKEQMKLQMEAHRMRGAVVAEEPKKVQ
jgi:hypothetical protein